MGSGIGQPQGRGDDLADGINYLGIWRTHNSRQLHGAVDLWAAHAGN